MMGLFISAVSNVKFGSLIVSDTPLGLARFALCQIYTLLRYKFGTKQAVKRVEVSLLCELPRCRHIFQLKMLLFALLYVRECDASGVQEPCQGLLLSLLKPSPAYADAMQFRAVCHSVSLRVYL